MQMARFLFPALAALPSHRGRLDEYEVPIVESAHGGSNFTVEARGQVPLVSVNNVSQASHATDLQRCVLILSEHATGNLPERQAVVALHLLRPDLGVPRLRTYLRKARLLKT
jgi:hypothetical protein